MAFNLCNQRLPTRSSLITLLPQKLGLGLAAIAALGLLSACTTAPKPAATQAQNTPIAPDTPTRNSDVAPNSGRSIDSTLPTIQDIAISAVPVTPQPQAAQAAVPQRDVAALLTLNPSANKPYTALGTRYVPMLANALYQATGWASWYGAAHQGQPTASGEVFDMNSFTAAHPLLPVPSYARVTNTSNGAQVIVRINDRGPFKDKRVMDVSYAAAKQLGFVNKGIAKVSVSLLSTQQASDWLKAGAVQPSSAKDEPPLAKGEPPVAKVEPPVAKGEPPVAKVEPPVAMSDVPRGYYVQLGAYKDNNAALVQAQRADQAVRDKGLRSALRPNEPLVQLIDGKAGDAALGKVSRILAGPFATKPEADKAAAVLGDALASKLFVIQQK
jgi:rare lipoprotein A